MKISKTNAVLIWKQLEDVLVPRLCLSLAERAVYSHLLRHSRLEDRLRLRFSILWLARGNRLSAGSVRLAVRRLVAKGALRLVERTKAGHVVEVRLPGEIRAVRTDRGARGPARLPRTADLRLLYRDGRLTATELTGRLRAVEALAAGKLRPALRSEDAKDQRQHAPARSLLRE